MYAIIEEGGSQFRVEEGQEVVIDYRDIPAGQPIQFDKVLAYRDDQGIRVGCPVLESARVTGEVLQVDQGPKLTVGKLRRRKNFRRRTGHRQLHTRVRIDKIEVN
ncbi:MAG: 50S ribosomal protein L21 [Patescibacteria group bacterium]|nr:50S ribosomal protein L21 [Patescibacteria group bacterium]